MLISMLALAGCGGRLQPATTAQLMPGGGKTAVVTVEGVTVMARANAWRGFPSDLDRQLTPILVTIRNDRAESVIVMFGEIALMAPNGRRFAALPPQTIEGTVVEPVSAFPAAAGRLEVFPERDRAPLDPAYRMGTGMSSAPYGWDAGYGGPTYATVRLPTKDMLARALPSGPIRPGEIAQGFIYLERVGPEGISLELVLPLVDAARGESLGQARIPFVFQ